MLLQPETALSSLKKIAEMCQSGSFTSSVMGVVVDMTRPLYRERDKDFIVEVKIVDELVNELEVFGVMVKYCSVYLFSKERKDLEVCNQIGQILLLDSFTFSLWNEIKLETKYRSTIERLSTFDHSHANLALFSSLSRAATTDPRTEDVVFRAGRLAEWFAGYFCEKQRPTLGISLVNNYCVMAEPFNMILKRWAGKMEEVVEKSMSEHLAFADAHGNRFVIARDCLPAVLPASEYLFVRNVRFIGNFYEVVLTETGYVLGLPMGKADYYQREMNYCAISRFNERFLLRNHKTCNLSKVNYVCPRTTPVLDLLAQMDLYENKCSTKEDLRMEDLYMVECVAVNFQGRLHMFHSELQMIADEDYVANLNDDERTYSCLTQRTHPEGHPRVPLRRSGRRARPLQRVHRPPPLRPPLHQREARQVLRGRSHRAAQQEGGAAEGEEQRGGAEGEGGDRGQAAQTGREVRFHQHCVDAARTHQVRRPHLQAHQHRLHLISLLAK